jgi:Holliday junction resolvasome RuvABC DNA-binding subunit
MVSSRAAEYITRFSKGVQKKTALKKIIEYRDECKGLYHQAESKNPMNYRAAEDKREYLEDMLARIHCLGEARDHLQKEINKAPSKAKNNMRSAVAFKPEEENKPKSKTTKTTKNKYFQRTEADLHKLGYEDANVVKYILRFQELGMAGNDASKCQEAADSYQDEWINNKESDPTDYAYCERADIAIDALSEAISYFENLQETLDAEDFEDKYVYNARDDEYVLKSECY